MAIRRILSAAALTIGIVACGGSDASGPNAGPPSRISITTAPNASAAVGGTGGTMAVRVTDAAGTAVSGASVTFSVSGSASVSPSSAQTDGSGAAHTVITVGTVSGPVTIKASIGGSTASATATVTVVAGAATRIQVAPKTAKLFYADDTLRLVVNAYDQYDNALSSGALSYSAVDPSLLTVDATGLVRVLRQGGTSLIVVSGGGHADTASITVAPAGVTPCSGNATPTSMAVGDIVTFSATPNACVSGSSSGAEYGLIIFNSTLQGGVALTANLTGTGVSAPSTSLASPGATLAPFATAVMPRGVRTTLSSDESFHVHLRQTARSEIWSRAAAARVWYRSRVRAAAPATTIGSYSVSPSFATIPSSPAVGDIVRVNVNATDGQACTNPIYRFARIAALGTKSIILADTLNPKDGFSDLDYQKFAARFDTLVYPVDVAAFGAPSDIDGNGRIAILFTKAVNELTPKNSPSFVGGFFYGRDLLPVTGTEACQGSNEGEMFYMLVPDPTGTVNGNIRRVGFVDTLTTAVLAHEFQHLINSSRRMYVNGTLSTDDEIVWLNEGLSHIAEELLYYRESGFAPRQNLDDPKVRGTSSAAYSAFKADAASNLSRFVSYLDEPEDNSPIANDDELSTRGATWSFLRYAVDQLYPADGDVWARFDNVTTTGIATLRAVFGAADLTLLFRNWAVAHYLDDLGATTDERLLHKSWNFRNIYDTTFGSYDASNVFHPLGYPLHVSQLPDGAATSARVRGASAAYFKLAVRPSREALLQLAPAGTAPDPGLQFVVVRTK